MTDRVRLSNVITNANTFDEACRTGAFGARTVTVHDGVFHADDVCSVALYASVLGYMPNVIRTRNVEHFAGVPIDVGEGKFDHHGARFGFDADGVPYSGFSRMWEIFQTEFNLEEEGRKWFKKVVVDPVSKRDNGVELDKGETHLFSFVHSYNPAYGEIVDENQQFIKAVEVAIPIIKRYIKVAATQDAVAARLEYYAKNVNPVVVVEPEIPWTKVLPATPAKFVIFFDGKETYYVQCVPESKEEIFSKKQALPESWSGARDEEFSKICGVNDGIFCHAARFICGFKSLESATKIANELVAGKFD